MADITPDERIVEFIRELEANEWLTPERRSWPRYLFHHTDITNVPSILRTGRLYSRAEATRRGLMQSDNASPQVISETDPSTLNLARLYFRPRSPTCYNNEGLRPRSERVRGSSCPIPVALIFDAATILSLPDVQIADGNRAKWRGQQASIGSGPDFLRGMPFEQIYHDKFMSPEERDEIVFRRSAEVGVPHAAPISALRGVFVRTPAELTTLHTLLERSSGPTLVSRYRPRISTGNKLFFNKWTVLQQASATDEGVELTFNSSRSVQGSYRAKFEFQDSDGDGPTAELVIPQFDARNSWIFPWTGNRDRERLMLRVELDDMLTFYGPLDRQTSRILRPS